MDNKAINTTAAVEGLFHAGRFADLLRVSMPFLHHGELSTHDRLLIARAMVHTGDIERARHIAETANEQNAGPLLRSRCELILGLVAKRIGDLPAARRRLQHSVHLAREAADGKQLAWSQLSLFRLLAEGEPEGLLSAVLAETRRVVSTAGDPHVAAYLHDCVSLLEAQTGRLDEARRHLQVAASIVERYPHAWIEQVVCTSHLCLACLEHDSANAAKHAAKARKLSEITGGYSGDFTVDINEANINILTGRFARAHTSLTRVLDRGRSFAKLAALEELVRMHFALCRLDDCQLALNLITEAETHPSVANCYPARRAAITRAKLFMRRGLVREAIDCARVERARARAVGDRPLCATLTFLEAEALAQTGDLDQANLKLFEAGEYGAAVFREYLGTYFETCSRVLEANACDLAPALRSRAHRIWRSEGNVCAFMEATSRNGEPRTIQDLTSEFGFEDRVPRFDFARDPQLTAAYVLSSVSAAFDLWFDPRLVAAELLNLAAATGCAAHVRVVTTSSRPTSRHAKNEDSEGVAVLTGSESTRVELRCSPTTDVLPNLAITSILRIGRAVGALAVARAEERNRAALWPADTSSDEESLFISSEMTTLAATARKVAPTPIPVLITGETGTGKEILARAIHAASARSKATFLPFNCSSGPRDMIDAQLFGHRRGAFTGASEHASGVIRAAAGGTLFLDEIGESPLDVQPKLLRFLESGEIHPVGEPLPVKVDVRVIAATNVDLDAAVSSGRFREDLFYRLNIVRLHLPALRERRVEIPVFAQHYLLKHARELAKGNLRLAEETMEYLLLYSWPGNVRQLANEMRRLAALAETDAVLMPEHLSPPIVASRRTVPASERTLDSNELVVRLDQPLAAATEHLERAMIPYALKQSAGRVEEAAQKLGLSRKGLYLKRMRLGLEIAEAQSKTA
jgi:DNA-binding NtrC family response regulator/tetratricopeptide (TPR) repeat protein